MGTAHQQEAVTGKRIDMPNHPLAEVFGFPFDNLSPEAQRYRNNRLCPYNNKVPSCTKDKANDPLGVCSVYTGDDIAITCPVRDVAWLIYDLKHDLARNCYQLTEFRKVYTLFKPALDIITTPEAGSLDDFCNLLQEKLDEKLENPPDAPTLTDLL